MNAQNQAIIDGLARSVQAGAESLSSITKMMGGGSMGQRWADAVKDRLAAWGVTASPAAEIRRIIMNGQRAQREANAALMQELIAAGYAPYNPKQEDYTAVVRVCLDGCESGSYPPARESGQAVAGVKAPKLLAKTNKKRLRKALQENKEHPGMQRINAIADKSTITTMVSGSVSSCLGALANSHKLARRLELIEREQVRAQRREKELQARIACLEARRDLEDAGKDWKEFARAILAAEPGITNTELGQRVGRSEASIRKYITGRSA